jgi:hypothetical protein
MTSRGSSTTCNEDQLLLSMNDVYIMQHVLATTALAAAVTHHFALSRYAHWPAGTFVFVFSVGLTCRP